MGISFQVLVGLASIGLYVFCDYTATRWAEQVGTEGFATWRLCAVSILAPLGIACFGLAGARMGLAAVSAYVNTGIVLGGIVVGVLVRAEVLTLTQKLGLAFGCVAMVLINLSKSPDSITSSRLTLGRGDTQLSHITEAGQDHRP